jgi:hypothetical protein
VPTRLKAIKKAGKRKLKWNLQKQMKSKENRVKEEIEQKFSQIDGVIGSVEDSWRKVK